MKNAVIWSVVLLAMAGTSCSKTEQGTTTQEHGRFPELRPAVELPPGYKWTFSDGPDFYCWTGDERVEGNDKESSGLGMYFGYHPGDLKKATAEERGTVAGLPVTWHITQNDKEGFQYETVIEYTYSPGFDRILLHVWAWGKTETQVRPLLKVMEDMKFAERNRSPIQAL